MPESLPSCFLPESGDHATFKVAVLDALIGDVAVAIQRCLFNAGFISVRASKVVHHGVYELSMRRGPTVTAATEVQIRHRIRHALREEGLFKASKKTLLVISVQRHRIVCGFYTGENEAAEADTDRNRT